MCARRTSLSIMICAPDALDREIRSRDHACMARTDLDKRALQKTYIKQWRKFRGLSQQQMAELLGISHTTFGRIERALSPYHQRFLEAVAEALECKVADLLMRDPSKPAAIWSIWDQLTEAQRAQAVAVLDAMMRTESPPPLPEAPPFKERRSSNSR